MIGLPPKLSLNDSRMTEVDNLAAQAGNELLQTIQTLRQLCAEREKSKMSSSKYRRLITELKDLSKLLAIFNGGTVDNY